MSDETPDRRKLTSRQAQRLSDLTDISAEKLRDRPLVELQEELQWQIDPKLFTHRLVCGRVVKENPLTGELEGVPGATVTAYDTDLSFLAHSPTVHPYPYPMVWLWPLKVQKEVMATAVTDACGKFCLWIPRFDIDWFVRWRLRVHCHFHFLRPRLKDLILPERQIEIDPGVIDPPPIRFEPPTRIRGIGDLTRKVKPTLRSRLDLIEQAERVAPPAIATEVREILEQGAGLSQMPLEECLELPALRPGLTPPPVDLRDRKSLERLDLPVPLDDLERLEPQRVAGPYWLHCHLHRVPEWYVASDIPDISFGVTQDVDNDGDQETIYSERFFEVRWDAGSDDLSDLVLQADDHALSSPICRPIEIDCGNEPVLDTVGFMSLNSAYHDDGDGYAVRPNGPSTNGETGPPTGVPSPQGPAQAPYLLGLNLFGCLGTDPKPVRWRVRYRYEGGADQTFTGLEWNNPREGGAPPVQPFIPDGDGWYQAALLNGTSHPNWLFRWPTQLDPNGEYEVWLEVERDDGTTEDSDPRRFRVDNTKPLLAMSAEWRQPGSSTWKPLDLANCPRIERKVGPGAQPVELKVTWSASAVHLRNAVFSTSGCGGGGFDGPADSDDARWWWQTPTVNNVSRTAEISLDPNRPAGCYGLRLDGHTRSFNPNGVGDGAGAPDWYIHQGAYNRAHLSYSISIVDG